jgi:hypothetical protein
MVNQIITSDNIMDKAKVLVGYCEEHRELHNVEITDIREQLHHMLYLLERRKEKRVHK